MIYSPGLGQNAYVIIRLSDFVNNQAALKDKELIENVRLKERTGGYHKYVDAAFIHNPDPQSSHFISGERLTDLIFYLESDRFDKDFSQAD